MATIYMGKASTQTQNQAFFSCSFILLVILQIKAALPFLVMLELTRKVESELQVEEEVCAKVVMLLKGMGLWAGPRAIMIRASYSKLFKISTQ